MLVIILLTSDPEEYANGYVTTKCKQLYTWEISEYHEIAVVAHVMRAKSFFKLSVLDVDFRCSQLTRAAKSSGSFIHRYYVWLFKIAGYGCFILIN